MELTLYSFSLYYKRRISGHVCPNSKLQNGGQFEVWYLLLFYTHKLDDERMKKKMTLLITYKN